jgi:hypothetical protein
MFGSEPELLSDPLYVPKPLSIITTNSSTYSIIDFLTAACFFYTPPCQTSLRQRRRPEYARLRRRNWSKAADSEVCVPRSARTLIRCRLARLPDIFPPYLFSLSAPFGISMFEDATPIPGRFHNGRHIPTSPNPRRLIVCCDGTWQSSATDRDNVPSNITRLARIFLLHAYDEATGTWWQQIVYYDAGVGTGNAGELGNVEGIRKGMLQSLTCGSFC